jgi:hypothetical protein
MRTIQCGFKGLVLEQCQFLPAHITASRDRINNSQVGFDKTSSSHHSSILHPMGTQISTTLRVGFLWNISSRTLGMLPLLALKANNLSSPSNNYGKTATNPNHLPVFKGLDVMLSLRK